ncbi:hypothetical protein [Planotetraspora silvatica]|uniref:hypothetical protein n=1 Tax=Planotetraspora silvatica TaxID=234614 RepID=UPI001951C542|nr:hypothetical protein [Planotetraspora silvatica]
MAGSRKKYFIYRALRPEVSARSGIGHAAVRSTTAIAGPPSAVMHHARIPPTTSPPRSALRPDTITCAPSAENASAIARPMLLAC